MTVAPRVPDRSLPFDPAVQPGDVLRAWPEDRPVVALLSGGPAGRWSRWSVIGSPSRTIRAGDRSEVGALLREIDRCESPPVGELPFVGGWVGHLAYELGHALEPACGPAHATDAPLVELHRLDGALVHDRLTGRWSVVGDFDPPALDTARVACSWAVGEVRSATGRERYLSAVGRALEYIAAGDVYQVNLTHALEARFEGSARALATRLADDTGAWYGGIVESADRAGAVVSASPELLLEIDGARTLTTRPIKGTLPAGARPADLLASEKDGAELAMIVDLMRNDLGRVCELGSVRVEDGRAIERHGPAGGAGVLHGVATVRGAMRPDATRSDALRAVFPAGSITGAPKIRAMQIVRELEPAARGAYCGSLAMFSDCGRASLSVAIRTAEVRGRPAGGDLLDGRLRLGVGAGIVADSEPAREWDETLAKARGFLETLGVGP